jgi:hypothetical protein
MPLHARNTEKEEGRLSEAGAFQQLTCQGLAIVHEEPITDLGSSSYFLECSEIFERLNADPNYSSLEDLYP